MKIPISLIIDDPAPVVSVYHTHAGKSTTQDGRPLVPTYPNSLLADFCALAEKRGLKGKFSVIPMPGNLGCITTGLEGVDQAEVEEWLEMVKTRLMPAFSICPEILTHNKAVDLATGEALPMDEREWSKTQDRTTMTPYIAKALSLLKEVGIRSIGVTSPWDFGIQVEEEYEHSISDAVKKVSGSDKAWYFLRFFRRKPNIRPWVAIDREDRALVSIPSSVQDVFWQTIECPRTDDAYIRQIADELISEDGTAGMVPEAIDTGCYPIMVTHWQSLMSNGLGTGLRALDVAAERINRHLADRVQWMSFEEILELVLSDRKAYPKPVFD